MKKFLGKQHLLQCEQSKSAPFPEDISIKLYLNPQQNYTEVEFDPLNPFFIPDYFIRVPDGSSWAIEFNNHYIAFYKQDSGSLFVIDHQHSDWTETGYSSIEDVPGVVIWQQGHLNDTEAHGEHNLSNELNDLCAEFGCPPGVDRMRWLRDHLRGTRKPETLYHYAASINTARGTAHYDGVITFPGRITGIEDYQQARAEIAKDGNVAPEQVNVHSLSIVS